MTRKRWAIAAAVLAIAAVFAFGGRSPDADLAACSMEITHLPQIVDVRERLNRNGKYGYDCMTARGWRSDCPNLEKDIDCYYDTIDGIKRAVDGWMSQHLFDRGPAFYWGYRHIGRPNH
jgi:hypothetical protein